MAHRVTVELKDQDDSFQMDAMDQGSFAIVTFDPNKALINTPVYRDITGEYNNKYPFQFVQTRQHTNLAGAKLYKVRKLRPGERIIIEG